MSEIPISKVKTQASCSQSENRASRYLLPPLITNWDHTLNNKIPSLHSSSMHDKRFRFHPSLSHKLEVLFKVFRPRPRQEHHIQVISVDDLNSELVNYMMRFIHSQVSQIVENSVRIFDDDWVRARMCDLKDLISYKDYVTLWSTLWRYILQASLSAVTLSVAQDLKDFSRRQSNLHCVNIIPFSSLTISMRAAHDISIDDAYSRDDHWHWLAGFWRGCEKANITVLIHDNNDIHSDHDVAWIDNENTIILLVIISKLGGLVLTSKQLRRVAFEITEWLRRD